MAQSGRGGGQPRRETLLDFFDDLAAQDEEFIVHDDGFRVRRFSYADIARASRAFAARLQRSDIGPGDKVILWSENRPEWIAALWGCLLNGTVAVPIDYRTSFEFIRRVQDQVQARLIVVGSDVEPGPLAGAETLRMSDWDWADAAVPSAVAVSRDTLAEIIFTSGATADPKGVLIQHRNVLANIVPVETRGSQVQALGRAVLSHPVSEPAAAQPHVRAGDGDLHPADAARHHHLSARQQPGRDRPADPNTARLGPGLRAEDPRCSAQPSPARVSLAGGGARGPAATGCGGGAIAGFTGCSVGSSGR